jgi:hypothetical protein
MTERSGHSSRCEQAEKPPCACECGGAEHGWQHALAIASAPTDGDLFKFARESDHAWERAKRQHPGQHKPGPQTAEGQQAAIKSFIADVIRWLRRDRKLHGFTKELGEPFRISRDSDPDNPRRRPTAEEDNRFVEEHVIPGLREEFGSRRIKEFQKEAVKAHFWCELLAQTAHALDEFRGHYDRAKRAVVAVLTSNSEKRLGGWVSFLSSYQHVIEKAVALLFNHLPRIATGGIFVEDGLRLIWPARVLAVLMCREPRRHRAVREYCVEPILKCGKAEIKEEVKERLRQAFPLDWRDSSASIGETSSNRT